MLTEDNVNAGEIDTKLNGASHNLAQEKTPLTYFWEDDYEKHYYDHDGQEIGYEEYLELKEFWVLEED